MCELTKGEAIPAKPGALLFTAVTFESTATKYDTELRENYNSVSYLLPWTAVTTFIAAPPPPAAPAELAPVAPAAPAPADAAVAAIVEVAIVTAVVTATVLTTVTATVK